MGSRCQTSKTTGAHCTFKKGFSLKHESFKPIVSSLSVSNNWNSHSTQLSSLAYSPVLTPYSLPNLPSGGPASLSALWGPPCFSGSCCGGVCCVPWTMELRLPSGHKLTGPAPGPPVKGPTKAPLCRASHSLILIGSCPWQPRFSGACWELSPVWLAFRFFFFSTLMRRLSSLSLSCPTRGEAQEDFYCSSDREDILTKITWSTAMPTFHFGPLGGLCLPLWKFIIPFSHTACLWPTLSFLRTGFWLSAASVSFLLGSDLCSQGSPQPGLASFKRCLTLLPASLDFLPKDHSIKVTEPSRDGRLLAVVSLFSFFYSECLPCWYRAEDLAWAIESLRSVPAESLRGQSWSRSCWYPMSYPSPTSESGPVQSGSSTGSHCLAWTLRLTNWTLGVGFIYSSSPLLPYWRA